MILLYEKIRVYRAKKMLDALNSESKLRILRRLLESPASATDLANEFGMTLPAVMLHLRDLEEAGLIRMVEVRRRKGRPAKLYTLTSKRITLNIRLDELLSLPGEDELNELLMEYIRRKVEKGFRNISVSDIAETLSVNRLTAAAISEKLQSDPSPLFEAIAERIMGELDGEVTAPELSKKLNVNRYWISRAVELLEERGFVEVRGGRIIRKEGKQVGGDRSRDNGISERTC